MEPNKSSRVLKWSLIIGIVIVINLFFNYTLSLIYKEPMYDAYCPNTAQVVTPVTNQVQCVAQGGQWNGNNPLGFNTLPAGKDVVPAGYCDLQFTCRQNFDSSQKIYDRNVFITLVILGALCVAGGTFFSGNVVVSQALSLGGVLSFIIASMRYWSTADNLIKVIILAIALAILIWVAMKKFKNQA